MTNEEIQAKEYILWLFEIYPKLSMSMIHITLNNVTNASVWKKVLNDMVSAGCIKVLFEHVHTPSGRLRTLTNYELSVEDEDVADVS